VKPLKLEIEGLRSYRKKQSIDFEPEGLLVITGSTGAGKSSILEAMMFALYGVHSSNSRSNKELIGDRCDEMRVTLDFEVQGKVYTAHRAVGRKGAGSFALAQGNQVICHDANRMTVEVIQLLGLDEEQFKKTVFLPQGAFQNFLTSKAKERTELLKRLLQVEPLDRLESRAQLWHSQVRQVLDRAEGSRSRYPSDPQGRVSQLQILLQQAEAQEAERTQHYQALTLLQQQLSQIQHNQLQIAQRRQVLSTFENLKDFDEPAWERLQQQLNQAHQEAHSQRVQLQSSLESHQQQPPPLDQGRLHQARREQIQLQQGQAELQRVGAEIQQLEAQETELQQRVNHLGQQLEQARENHQQLQPQLLQLRQQVQQLHQLWQEQVRRQQDRQAIEQQLSQQETRLQHSRNRLDQAQVQLQEARLRWHEAQLYHLCGQHTPGQPCPVCTQALPDGWQPPQPPQGDSLDEAEAAWSQAQSLWQEDQAQLTALLQQLSRFQPLPSEVRAQDLEELEARLREEENRAALNQQDQARCEGEMTSLQRQAKATQSNLAGRQEHLRQLQAQHAQTELSLQSLLQGACLEQLEQEHNHWQEEFLRLQQQLLQAQTLEQQLSRQIHEEVNQPRQQADFLRLQCSQILGVSPQLSLPALLERLLQELQETQLQLEQGQHHRHQLQSQFQELLSQLGLPAWEAAQDWLRQAQDRASRARHEVELAQQQVLEVSQLEALLIPARARLEQISSLTRMLGHQKAKGTRMTFPQWYMQQRQSELLNLASQHLESLSGGQFRFEEEMEDAQSFKVLDLFSGVPRTVNTLSGGETFLASLSLAVALAELVGRRGGQLQALFLDEGFGTLSAECLDRALTALEQLAAQGRLIGIISHVPLIAERIEQVWWVRKSPGGSEIVKATEHMRRELLRQELATFDPRLHPLFT